MSQQSFPQRDFSFLPWLTRLPTPVEMISWLVPRWRQAWDFLYTRVKISMVPSLYIVWQPRLSKALEALLEDVVAPEGNRSMAFVKLFYNASTNRGKHPLEKLSAMLFEEVGDEDLYKWFADKERLGPSFPYKEFFLALICGKPSASEATDEAAPEEAYMQGDVVEDLGPAGNVVMEGPSDDVVNEGEPKLCGCERCPPSAQLLHARPSSCALP